MVDTKKSDTALFRGLFQLGGKLKIAQRFILSVLGIFLTIMVWWFLVKSGLAPSTILPYPGKVLSSIPGLFFEDALIGNLAYSFKLNILGYGYALLIGLPLGYLLGLVPLFRGLSETQISVLRYLPLAAATGVFILWFGTDDLMKVAFLTFSILVYLVPTMIIRIDEVDRVYLDTLKTLGASKWQTIRHVYFPDVLSRVWGDVIVLIAISWGSIILAELINRSAGGVGSLIWLARRTSRPDKMFVVLFIIMMVGLLQDHLFRWVGRLLFPYRFKAGGGT